MNSQTQTSGGNAFQRDPHMHFLFLFCKAYKSLFTRALTHFLTQLFKLIFITQYILKNKKNKKNNHSGTRHCLAEESCRCVCNKKRDKRSMHTHTLVFSNARHLMF